MTYFIHGVVELAALGVAALIAWMLLANYQRGRFEAQTETVRDCIKDLETRMDQRLAELQTTVEKLRDSFQVSINQLREDVAFLKGQEMGRRHAGGI